MLQHQNALQRSIHAPYAAYRDHILQALTEAGLPETFRWASRMAECGNHARLAIDQATHLPHPWLHRCGHKLCPFCAVKRSSQAAHAIKGLIDKMKAPRTLVLTVKSKQGTLAGQLSDLRNNFAKLRRSPLWKKNVISGIYTVEVTLNEETRQWHPHLHIIFEGNYIHQPLLKALWLSITGDSDIIWLKPIYDAPGAAWELAKYCGKPQHVETLTHAEIAEYATATSGKRQLQTFGKKPTPDVEDVDQLAPPPAKQISESISRIAWLSAHDAPQARRLAILIAARYPVFRPFLISRDPNVGRQLARPTKYVAAKQQLLAEVSTPQLEAWIVQTFSQYMILDQAGVYATADTPIATNQQEAW